MRGATLFSLTTRSYVIVIRGDITEEGTEAIVNAANGALSHGAGVRTFKSFTSFMECVLHLHISHKCKAVSNNLSTMRTIS